MVKTKSNSKRLNTIVVSLSLFLIILVLINLVISLKLREFSDKKYSEIYTLNNVLSEQQKEYTSKLGEVMLLTENINNINNLENSIEEIKKEYFDNALKYETMVSQGEGSKKIAYLTIDDGPYSYTPAFLDVLDQYDVLATFFLLGKTKDEYDPIYKRISNSGHTVANHTYSHAVKNGLYSSVDSFVNDVLKQENFLYEKIGVKTNIVRFPGGSTNAKGTYKSRILERLRTHNYGYIDWNVSTGDGGGRPTKESTYNNVVNKTGNRNIIVVLMHDYSYASLSALPSIIDGLKEKDYIFLPLFYNSTKVIK